MRMSVDDVTNRLRRQLDDRSEQRFAPCRKLGIDDEHTIRAYLHRERGGHTLQTTALVHEAYLRLVKVEEADWHDRTHFFAVCALIMRRILVDHARRRASAKRGGQVIVEHERTGLRLDDLPADDAERASELIALDQALTGLSAIDARRAEVVELRFFGGLSIEETAEALKVSPQTVMRDWRLARAWLTRELGGAGGPVGTGSSRPGVP
jgi:RNA polymerase sigma factor (TIGR02999 family)